MDRSDKTLAKLHMRPLHILTILLFAALLLLAPGVGAQHPSLDFKTQLSAWQEQLDHAENALEADFRYANVSSLEEQMKQIIRQAQEVKDDADQRQQSAQKQLDKLGEPPGEDQPPEEEEIAKLRQELGKRLAQARAQSTRTELIMARAEDVLSSIAAWKRARVRAQILQRSPMPVTLAVWREAGQAALDFTKSLLTSPISWWEARQEQADHRTSLLWLLLLPLAGLLIGWGIRHFILKQFGRNPNEIEPSYARRILKASANGLANSIIPVAIILVITVVLAWMGVLMGLFAYLIYSVAGAISAFLLVYGLSRSALSPQMAQWRVVPVEPAHTTMLLHALATVFGLLAIATVLLATAWNSQQLTPSLEAVFFLIQSIVTALALMWLLTPKYWASSIVASQEMGSAQERAEVLDDEDTSKTADQRAVRDPRWIRLVGVLRWLVLLTPLLAVAGYGRLAFHLQSRLVVTGALVGVMLLVRLALHEALEHLLIGHHRRRRRRSGRRGAGEDGDKRVSITSYWAGLGIDILLLVPTLYLLLLAYGVPLTTIGLWTRTLLSGMTIGNITIAPLGILAALLVLVLGIVATNLVRRWMANRVLPNTRLDTGARDSIAAGTTYVGVAIALVLAVGALGINFSNLALIAGALSFGVGFGLQNVVQNFAAGIVLLIERPIKIGDWIQLGNEHGIVKRISVRSTEIETFNRTSIFVPNSELIANQVTNWTHRSNMVRQILPVQVAQGADPAEVEDVLLQCAGRQRHVLRFPESYVWFRGFEDGVLNFELRVYLDNADYWVDVNSGLYGAIVAAFKEAGITIPYPQRDVHMHRGPESDLDMRLPPPREAKAATETTPSGTAGEANAPGEPDADAS
ncbi:MAG TPA: DUF3772 domain-containing protein [Salinisphaeraceae bacterium]|nr:DUF3772 domain-containing protein [Salinisphaeraceae bacterium]